jgi:hypothetical protein
MDPLRKLTALPRAPVSDHGLGGPLLLLGLLLQGVVLVGAAGAEPTLPEPAPVGLSAAAVIEPGDGTPPGELGSRDVWPVGSRLQITFTPEQELWTAVLWFDGPDTVVPLYPVAARDEAGWTVPGTPYVVPDQGAYLRLTTTSPAGDLLAIVAARQPDPEVVRVLLNPQPGAVRSLRERLAREGAARARGTAARGTGRFLPTADGRAVAVPWTRTWGTGTVAMTWEVHVR